MVASARLRARGDRVTAAVLGALPYEEGQPIDPRALAASNGGRPCNGNNGPRSRGTAAPPGEDAPTPAQAVSASTEKVGHVLRIVLAETEDSEGDQERLRAVVNALRDFQGDDEVRLSIHQRDGEEVELELPRARRCEELQQRLKEIVGGWGAVEFA